MNQIFKTRSIVWVAVIMLAVASFGGCKKTKDPEPPVTGDVTNADINKWVLDSMRLWYYWTDFIPSSPNMNASPTAFFESILKRPDDRFSWIQNNEDLRNQLSGVIKTSGLSLAWFQIGTSNAGATVRYVHKGSPAELAGIKRGDLFIRINGDAFTLNGSSVTNAGPIFANDPFTLTFGHLEGPSTITAGSDITLTPIEGFQETAILMDTVLTTPNGTKVGYLFYNRFLGNQAQQLVDAFREFKTAGITELIIDERYNSGGAISVAGLMSAMIHKNFNINQDFVLYKFNNRVGGTLPLTYGDVFGAANANLVTNTNLGMDRVFILATGNSASASELLINNLRPFMGAANVIHIGGTTTGKDDASITISSTDPKFTGEDDWGIQPIVLKYTNRDGGGNFVNGLVPTHVASESIPLAPMGSEEDPLIGKALSIIDPSIQAIYGRLMSIRKERAALFDMERLEEFNKDQTRPIPLDVTETLKKSGVNPLHFK